MDAFASRSACKTGALRDKESVCDQMFARWVYDLPLRLEPTSFLFASVTSAMLGSIAQRTATAMGTGEPVRLVNCLVPASHNSV
jgi:hypothetical protein